MFITFLESWQKPEKKNIILCNVWKYYEIKNSESGWEQQLLSGARDPAALVAKNIDLWVLYRNSWPIPKWDEAPWQ